MFKGQSSGWRCACRMLLSLLLLAVTPTFAEQKQNLRILIDSSDSVSIATTSLKLADSLEMLVQLLPESSEAGVWVFGAQVHELVAPQAVNAAWRAQAQLALGSLVATGEFSDIPAAIDAATADLESGASLGLVGVVLLTDGKIAVSSSPMINANASRRLLTRQASELAEKSIPVHTVALTDDADRNFLQTLARTTGGLALRGRSDRELVDSVFQLLQTIVPTPRAPLTGGTFAIDAGVKAFTAVMFHRGEAGRIGLEGPDGKVYRPTSVDDGTVWFVNDSVALATVTQPDVGAWRLRASDLDGAHVRLQTELGIGLARPDGQVSTGEPVVMRLQLQSPDGSGLSDEVLSQLSISLSVRGPVGGEQVIGVSAADRAAGDDFAIVLPSFESAGRYEIAAQVRSAGLAYEFPVYIDVIATQSREAISTRVEDITPEGLEDPVISLGVFLLVVLAILLAVLRRRRERKLKLWQNRFADPEGKGESGLFPGIRTQTGQHPKPP